MKHTVFKSKTADIPNLLMEVDSSPQVSKNNGLKGESFINKKVHLLYIKVLNVSR